MVQQQDDLHHHGSVRLWQKLFGGIPIRKGWPLLEGDRFHPEENVAKMARGEALADQDRFPWLLRLHDVIERLILLHGSKALPTSTSSPLPHSLPGVFFLLLHGDYELIRQRMVARRGHFMKADLLDSQFDVLEIPVEEQEVNILRLDVSMSIRDMAVEVEKHLSSLKSPR
ncbi:putative gluconokinase isoform X4 [Vanacampus margaritifer]